MDGSLHLRLSPQCGICADSIQTKERAVAVSRNNSNPTSYHCSLPFGFPNPGLQTNFVVYHSTNEIAFCNDGDDCEECEASLEAAAFHRECYEIFMHKCPGVKRQILLRRLLVLASARRPWREAQPLFLPSRVDNSTLDAVARLFGLPQLCGLPAELLEMIHGYSAHASFWRAISALRIAAHVSETKDELPLSQGAALRHVASWERGGQLDLDQSESQTLPPIVRLTMDSDGISRVERLPSHPRYLRKSFTHTAYIVGSDSDEALSGVEVELVDGHLRLILPSIEHVPRIWDTPTPPPLSISNISTYDTSGTWSRLFAVDADSIRGMTFFYYSGRLCDIHIHRPEAPSAYSTYSRLSRSVREDVSWIYLPIPHGDRLTTVGVRQQLGPLSCHLFRLEKSGDAIIGTHDAPFTDRVLGTGTALTLIYSEPNPADRAPRVGLLGAYSGGPPSSSEDLRPPDDFPMDRRGSGRSPIARQASPQAEYFSWAPLEGVVSALIFRSQDTGCCRGIVFHYLNGGSRAVGECRLHVDPVERVIGPKSLCVQTESYATDFTGINFLYRTRVDFSCRRPHQRHIHHDDYDDMDEEEDSMVSEWDIENEWTCYPMVGYVKFWFSAESSCLKVVQE
ncbi:hypothetical protein V8C35DRAFT_330312 [Trichoderma chlorosporum]